MDKQQIKKLGQLARIEINEKEAESLEKDLEKILDFVSVLKEIKIDSLNDISKERNVMREDGNPHKAGEYSEDLLRQAPEKKNGFIKVKKIL